MELMDSGNEAKVYLKGSVIFKLFNNKETGQKSAAVENSVLEFLQTKSFPAPKPKGLFEYNNRFGVKMDYVPGPSLQEDFYKPGHGRLVGKILGNLHHNLHNITNKNLPSILTQSKDLFESLANEFAFSKVISSLQKGKLVLAHGDFHPANIIDGPEGEIVIDWSRAYIGPAEADIANTLVIFMLFPVPLDSTTGEKYIIEENIIEAQRTYLSEYTRQTALDRLVVEEWALVNAALYLTLNQETRKDILEKIDSIWP